MQNKILDKIELCSKVQLNTLKKDWLGAIESRMKNRLDIRCSRRHYLEMQGKEIIIRLFISFLIEYKNHYYDKLI